MAKKDFPKLNEEVLLDRYVCGIDGEDFFKLAEEQDLERRVFPSGCQFYKHVL